MLNTQQLHERCLLKAKLLALATVGVILTVLINGASAASFDITIQMSYPNGSSVMQGDTIHFNAKYTASGQVQVRSNGSRRCFRFLLKNHLQLTGRPVSDQSWSKHNIRFACNRRVGRTSGQSPTYLHYTLGRVRFHGFPVGKSESMGQQQSPPLTITANSSPNPPQTPSSQNPPPNGGGIPCGTDTWCNAAVAVAALLAGLLLYQRKPKRTTARISESTANAHHGPITVPRAFLSKLWDAKFCRYAILYQLRIRIKD